ncbi:MAG: crossover junction endodeoxyribonuclease RuvC [Vicinamibacterales bacterium]
MRIFGIDPGSERTGYGCVETDGRRHQLVTCGAIAAQAGDDFPGRLAHIHRELSSLLASCKPDCVAIENLFHAKNVRSALKLGHARGVAMLAAVQAGCPVAEYTPAEIKRAVVGYGRAEKHQVGQMVKLLLGLDAAPSPHDAADALAVAICHMHSAPPTALTDLTTKADLKVGLYASKGRDTLVEADLQVRLQKSWRQYRPPTTG